MADIDAEAWKTAELTAGRTVSQNQHEANTSFIVGLKADGVWSKLFRFFPIYNETIGGYRDFVARAVATPVGSPTFVAKTGITTSATAYLNLGTPGASPYLQNSASFGCDKVTNNGLATLNAMGAVNTAGAAVGLCELYLHYTDGGNYSGINSDNVTFGTPPTTTNGVFLITRNASSGAGAVVLYQDATPVFTWTAVLSTGVPNQNFCLGGMFDSAGTFSNGGDAAATMQFHMAMIGGGLTSTDVTNIGTRWATYKSQLAAGRPDPTFSSAKRAVAMRGRKKKRALSRRRNFRVLGVANATPVSTFSGPKRILTARPKRKTKRALVQRRRRNVAGTVVVQPPPVFSAAKRLLKTRKVRAKPRAAIVRVVTRRRHLKPIPRPPTPVVIAPKHGYGSHRQRGGPKYAGLYANFSPKPLADASPDKNPRAEPEVNPKATPPLIIKDPRADAEKLLQTLAAERAREIDDDDEEALFALRWS